MVVTPGMPATADIATERRLIGRVTPVNMPEILTAIRVNIPVSMEEKVLFKGFLERTKTCIKNKNKNVMDAIIKNVRELIFITFREIIRNFLQ